MPLDLNSSVPSILKKNAGKVCLRQDRNSEMSGFLMLAVGLELRTLLILGPLASLCRSGGGERFSFLFHA